MSYWECLQVSEILCLYNCHRVIRPCMLQGLSFQWALLLQSFPLHFLCFFTLFLSFKSSWHWQLIFKSHLIIAMATVGCSKFWTNAGIVQLSAFPSLRGTPAFTWHRRWRESPELLSLVEDFLPSVELVKFLRFCRAERLALRSLSPQSPCIPTQLLCSWVNLHTSSSLQN